MPGMKALKGMKVTLVEEWANEERRRPNPREKKAGSCQGWRVWCRG